MRPIPTNQTKLGLRLTTLLFIFGLWPNTSLKRTYKVYSYVLHFLTSFLMALTMLVKLVNNINNVEAVMELLYPMLMVIAYLLKLLNYYTFGENIVNSSNKLLNLQLNNNRSDGKIYHSRLSSLTKLISFLYCVSNFAWGVACSKTFLGASIDLPVSSEYPLNWRENKLYFWIVYLHQSFSGFILVNSHIGMDCFAYYLMGMTAAHFEILQSHIQLIGSGIDEGNRNDLKELEFSSLSIKLCIDEHQQILRLVRNIEKYFSIQFVSQIFLSGVILSGGTFQLTIITPSENLFQFTFIVTFMLTVTTQTLFYTYFGDGIETTSNLVSNAIYSCNWYVLPASIRKDLIIAMERVKRYSSITAGKLLSLNLALFSDIITLAYRLYTLLKGAF
ncbi:odorant receptor 2a-like [Bradysia coprophila]|uniref:odorant receptor 2a-like n=1 Tax=Bradysia coprophila TaxID=38358 RepID=UPI00187DDA9F|nr:odorant receptor 2a-like [Bradysia coprophila]